VQDKLVAVKLNKTFGILSEKTVAPVMDFWGSSAKISRHDKTCHQNILVGTTKNLSE
jgi:hypothetical protein